MQIAGVGDYLKRTVRFYALIALVPLLVGAVGAWPVPWGLGMLFVILAVPLALIALAVGTLIWIDRGTKLPVVPGEERQRTMAIALAPLLLVATLAAAGPLVSAGSFVSSLARLAVNRDHFEAIIASVRKTGKPALVEMDQGLMYSADPGPPVRVAFSPRDLRALWGVIAYDPTGDVTRIEGWGPGADHSAAPEGFGGIFDCRHLWGDYYSCAFDF